LGYPSVKNILISPKVYLAGELSFMCVSALLVQKRNSWQKHLISGKWCLQWV